MLAYAADRPIVAGRPLSPTALAIVIGLHAAAIALAITARMEFAPRLPDPPIKVDIITPPKPPPPSPSHDPTRPQPTRDNQIDHTPPVVPTPPADGPVSIGDTPFDPGSIAGQGTVLTPDPLPRPPLIARSDAALLTPAWEVKPPYPASKIASQEEAVLRL